MRKLVQVMICLILLFQPVVLLAAGSESGCPMAAAGMNSDSPDEPCCCCDDDCGETVCDSGCLLGVLYQGVVDAAVGGAGPVANALTFIEPGSLLGDGFDPPQLRPPIPA